MYRPTSTLSLAHSVHRLHWEMFPAHRDVTPQIYQELKGMIIHGAYGPSQSHCCPPSRRLCLCRYSVFNQIGGRIGCN
jgi:hypothetical protein